MATQKKKQLPMLRRCPAFMCVTTFPRNTCVRHTDTQIGPKRVRNERRSHSVVPQGVKRWRHSELGPRIVFYVLKITWSLSHQCRMKWHRFGATGLQRYTNISRYISKKLASVNLLSRRIIFITPIKSSPQQYMITHAR